MKAFSAWGRGVGQGRVEEESECPVGLVTSQVGCVCVPQDEALGRPPPGIKCHWSLPLTEPSSEMPHSVCLSAVLQRRKNGHSPLVRGSHSSTPPGGPPGVPVDPTVSHTRVAATGPQAGGRRLMGGHEAGRWAEHMLLFAMLVSGAGISAKSPRDVSGDGTWQGTLPLCADGSPAPVLAPPRPLSQDGPASCCHPHPPLPARAPAGVGSASHTGLLSPASCLVDLGVCSHKFYQAGAQGHQDEA